MKTLLYTKTKIVMAFVMAILLASASVFGQKTKSSVFEQANLAMQNAKSLNADILVPMEYAEGLDNYNDAQKDFDAEKGIVEVEATLAEAVIHFNRSSDFSVSAKLVFANSLNARLDALSAGADKFAKEQWLEAEEQFVKATEQLEKGDRDDSYEESVEAIEMYRKAELLAIKIDLLDETRKYLKKAEELDVDKKAPKTLKKANSLFLESEKDIETNRYDRDYPRILAKQAKYEAKHAIFLNNYIIKIDDENLEMEDVILNYEQPIINIAEAIGFVAQFDKGIDMPEKTIIDYVNNLQEKNSRFFMENIKLSSKNEQLEASIEVLNKERDAINEEFKTEIGKRTAQMTAQMKAIENEKKVLALKIDHQTRIDNKFNIVYGIFDNTEAVVSRTEKDIIIRMNGFNFEVGKSEIKPADFELLTKVQTAIKTFPNSKIIVQGYTDSFGGDVQNLKLSQERSDAVTKYLKANMDLKNTDISSIGYGENNPIANNETKEGRKQNRRIDIIIVPIF
ncbi:MAG: OmpA family protein [Salinivirgaceae bacterium]|jgi:OOP family OmpA-OmpF porin|nr:OmpA family protein [Salinivirgaceae bacterium]